MILNDGFVTVKQLSLEDADDFYDNIKDPEISKYSGPYQTTSVDTAKDYIQKCNRNINNKISYCLGIYYKNKVIGSIGLINIKGDNCEIGFWLGKKYWGKGLMRRAIILTVNFAFRELGIRRIIAYTDVNNIASVNVLLKSGFKKNDSLINNVHESCFELS